LAAVGDRPLHHLAYTLQLSPTADYARAPSAIVDLYSYYYSVLLSLQPASALLAHPPTLHKPIQGSHAFFTPLSKLLFRSCPALYHATR